MVIVLVAAVHNAIGFLIQIIPFALLCIAPFRSCIRSGRASAWVSIAVILAIALIPFLIVATTPVFDGRSGLRFFIQNLIFFGCLAALFFVFVRAIDAPSGQKAFVLSLVSCFGMLVTCGADILVTVLGISEDYPYMYSTAGLISFVATIAVLFVPLLLFMRRMTPQLMTPDTENTWWRMAALPAVFTLCVVFGVWIPPLEWGAPLLQAITLFALIVFGLFMFRWVFELVESSTEAAARRAQLEATLGEYEVSQQGLRQQLTEARERVVSLEQAVEEAEKRADDASAAHEGAGMRGERGDEGARLAAREEASRPIVLATVNHAVSFRPDDVLYAESLNRTRLVHLVGDEPIRVNMTLAQIVEHLPEDRFAYAHRSLCVNLDHVRSVSPTELVLSDGTHLPVSRRRYQEFRTAFAERAC